jgi:hypothetical protein
LRGFAFQAGFRFAARYRLGYGVRRVLLERFLQGLPMLFQFADRLVPIEVAQAFHPLGSINQHVAFHRGTDHTCEPGCLDARHALADQPEHFHPALHLGIGMFKTFLGQQFQIFFGEGQRHALGHPWLLSKKGIAFLREFEQNPDTK